MPFDEMDSALCWDMIRHAEYGIEFVRGMTFDQYVADLKTRFALERVIEIIGEAARGLSATARDRMPAIPCHGVIAQRHKLAHEYGTLDQLRIWEVATKYLPDMVQELRRILSHTNLNEEDP